MSMNSLSVEESRHSKSGRGRLQGWSFTRGGETSHMKGVGMLVGNFGLNPQRRPIWAWPKLFLTPKRDQKNIHNKSVYFYIFSLATLNETFTAKYDGVFPRTPLGPVQTSCFCRAELNSGIKFDKSTTEARRLHESSF